MRPRRSRGLALEHHRYGHVLNRSGRPFTGAPDDAASYSGVMPSLTRDEAVARAAMLDVSRYDLDLRLHADRDTFDVTATIDVGARFTGATFLDLAAHALTSVRLDGAPLDVADLDHDRLPLDLTEGRHRIVVQSVMAYSHDGEGMHRMVDPADGRTYLYAMSFLDSAPRVFACFDQPDLKAVFHSCVSAPPEWNVLGNSRATYLGTGRWELGDTQPISTYLWTLVAGPYHSISSEHHGIPLGLHAVQSLGHELDRDADELFTVTGQAFDAFHELFGIRYPFGDYHQAFVPEFNAGAMENPGCVTLRDSMISRSMPTDAERGQRACTMVHEMAHMWFGNLVSMRWWDDLWLNESFAEYMGHRVTHDATAFDDSWVDFGFVRKRWGLAADQRHSTHPVAGNGAADAATALNDFDGISYAKGAAVLRQLATYLGDDVFLAGVRRHLRNHEYGNADFADLIGAWESSGAPDLSGWTHGWLRTAGVDTLCWRDGAIVRTQPASAPARRPHTLSLLTVEEGGTKDEVVEVDTDVTPVCSRPGPGTALLVDGRSQTWAKVRYDGATLEALPCLLPGIADPVIRAAVWLALRDGAEDGSVDPQVVVDVLCAALPAEDRDVAVVSLSTWIRQHLLGRLMEPVTDRVARDRLAEALRLRLNASPPGSSLQLAAARGLATITADVRELTGWLDADALPGLVVDEDWRWHVLSQLARRGAVEATDIDTERRRDRSAQGQIHAEWCSAALPDAQSKARTWERISTDRTASNYQVHAWSQGFWHAEQRDLCAQYVPRYFIDIPATSAFRSDDLAATTATLAFPRFAVEPRTLSSARTALAGDALPTGVRRALSDQADDLEAALRVRSGRL